MTRRWPAGQREVNGVARAARPAGDVAADEAQRLVRPQHAGKEACLAEDLEAVADPEHEARRAAANSATDAITGEKRAIAPQRR